MLKKYFSTLSLLVRLKYLHRNFQHEQAEEERGESI